MGIAHQAGGFNGRSRLPAMTNYAVGTTGTREAPRQRRLQRISDGAPHAARSDWEDGIRGIQPGFVKGRGVEAPPITPIGTDSRLAAGKRGGASRRSPCAQALNEHRVFFFSPHSAVERAAFRVLLARQTPARASTRASCEDEHCRGEHTRRDRAGVPSIVPPAARGGRGQFAARSQNAAIEAARRHHASPASAREPRLQRSNRRESPPIEGRLPGPDNAGTYVALRPSAESNHFDRLSLLS